MAQTRRSIPAGADIVSDRYSDESAANTELTVSTATGALTKILFVTVKYSASVSKTVTATLNSGVGATSDTLLQNIVLSSATDAVWTPDTEMLIQPDDVLDVVAPAGGGGVKCTVVIYTRVFP